MVARFRVNTFLTVTICPVSGCIGSIEEKFDVESCLGIQNSSLIQCKTATVNFISTVQCYNQGAMTKVKNGVVRLCCYSYSDYCSVVSKQAGDRQSSAGYLIVCRRLL